MEIDNHDISAPNLNQLTLNSKMFVSDDGLRYEVWLPESVLADLQKSKAFPSRQDRCYQAKSIDIRKGICGLPGGLAIEGNNRFFHYSHPFWLSAQNVLPDGFSAEGKDAFRFWCEYWEALRSFQTGTFVIAARRNPELFSEIRVEQPYLLDHPAVQKALTDAFREGRINQPKSSGGRPVELTQAKFELYHWVYWYRFQGMSLNDACVKIYKDHQNLIPREWEDTNATLKKYITRLDKYPRISLRDTLKTPKK